MNFPDFLSSLFALLDDWDEQVAELHAPREYARFATGRQFHHMNPGLNIWGARIFWEDRKDFVIIGQKGTAIARNWDDVFLGNRRIHTRLQERVL